MEDTFSEVLSGLQPPGYLSPVQGRGPANPDPVRSLIWVNSAQVLHPGRKYRFGELGSSWNMGRIGNCGLSPNWAN